MAGKSSFFEFKELTTAAANVKFKSIANNTEFQENMRKLERAIIDNKSNEYDTAIKSIKELTKNVKKTGTNMKTFIEKLKQLESSVKTRGIRFSAVRMEDKIAVAGAQIGGRKMSSDSEASSSHHSVRTVEDKKEVPHESSRQQLDNHVEYGCEEVGKLCAKLQKACEQFQLKDVSPKTKLDKSEANDQKSQFTKYIGDANEQADRLIEHLEMLRSTSGVKGKVQERQVQNVADKKEQETKAKITTITEWLDKLKKQVDKCKYDVTDFQKLKYKDGSHDEMTKCKTCLTDICNKLKNTSEHEKRLIDELKKQNELIETIWTEHCGDSKKEPTDTISALNDCKRCLFENRKSLVALEEVQEAMKSEISFLKEDIAHFDEEMEVTFAKAKAEKSGILQDIRNLRKQLNDKKKKIAKSAENRVKDKKEESTKLRQHVISLWKVAFGTDKDLTNVENDVGRTQTILHMLNDITPELQKLGNISSDLEAASNYIHQNVIGVLPFKKDAEELKTPIGDLQYAVKTLKSCSTETKVFAANFAELDRTMSTENTNATISGKCNLMIEAAQRWRKENQEMKVILQRCQKLLPLAYFDLMEEPYCFVEPHIDQESIKERYPDWLQEVALCISKVRGCIMKNKDSFRQRFTETDLVFNCLFQMYKSITKEEYKDNWKKSKPGQQTDDGKSSMSSSHVTFVIEDICQRINAKSAVNVEQDYRKHIERLREVNRELEEEKKSLLTRLSKFAGANLTDNNPNIADLSDPYRPTKLAEEYSELYDNEWTNAYEDLEKAGKSEKDIQKLLSEILTGAYSVCKDIGEKQDSVIRTELLSPTDSLINENASNGSKTRNKSARSSVSKKPKDEKTRTEAEGLSAVHSKALSELRKQTAKSSVPCVITYFKTQPQFRDWFTTERLEMYTAHCIKLTWLMSVQNPPVHLEKDVKADGKFDTTKYKSYTKGGKKIAFLVWPALYLHKEGPLLAKGVAQGK